MDSILLLSIFLVFVTALVGSFLQRRRRDRVLAELQDYHAIARMQNGERVWGRMEVYPNGLELRFSQPYQNHRGHLATSYILFRDSIEQLQCLYRYNSELSPSNQARRERELRRTHSPGWWRIALRRAQNFMNTFRDAINESMGMLLTRMKGTSSMSLFRTQDERLKKIGSQALGVVGNAYDPILERYLGKRVIVELQTPEGEKEEYAGLLREYSQAWLSVFDCRTRETNRLPLGDHLRLSLQRDLDFWMRVERSERNADHLILQLRLTSFSEQALFCKSIETGSYQFPINHQLENGETAEFRLDDLPFDKLDASCRDRLPIEFSLIAPERLADADKEADSPTSAMTSCLPDVELLIESEREVDVFAPRTLAVLRHGSV